MRIALLLVLALTGCARFTVIQTDVSPGERTITTKVSGYALFSSAQALTKITALTTDREQRFNAGSLGQQGSTNAIAALHALARIAEAVRPTP